MKIHPLRRPRAYQGFEVSLISWEESVKMWLSALLAVGLLYSLVVCILIVFQIGPHNSVAMCRATLYGLKASIFGQLPWSGFVAWFRGRILAGLMTAAIRAALLALPTWATFTVLLRHFKHQAEEQNKPSHVRGVKLISTKELRRHIKKKYGRKSRLQIPAYPVTIPLPTELETRHIFLCGRPGCGKTVLLNSLIAQVLDSQPLVIHDYKGDFTEKFFCEKTCLLLNPLDARCPGWSIAQEIEEIQDVNSIAESLIPLKPSEDPFWTITARQVFSGILCYCLHTGRTTNRDIWRCAVSGAEHLVQELQGIPGAEQALAQLQQPTSKRANSIVSMMEAYLDPLKYLPDGPFSVRRWVRSLAAGERVPTIIAENKPDQSETIKPVLTLFFDLLAKFLLALPDDNSRRCFIFLDELGQLRKLSALVPLLTQGRSKGLSCFIGIQDTGQIQETYGLNLRQSIVSSCASSVLYGVSDPDMAQFLSKKVGEREVIEPEMSHSMGVNDDRSGVSLTTRRRTERLLLPSQFTALEDLEAFLIIGGFNPAKIKLKYQPRPAIATSFIARPGLKIQARQDRQVSREDHAQALRDYQEEKDHQEGWDLQARQDYQDRDHQDQAHQPLEAIGDRQEAQEDPGHQDQSLSLEVLAQALQGTRKDPED